MKRQLKKIIGILMIGVLLVGCKGTPTNEGTIKNQKEQDIVTLKWYMALDSIAKDTSLVIDALNAYTREKIGVEIEYHPIINQDYKESMPTLINSGENYDICFTSSWSIDYQRFAKEGAFLDMKPYLTSSEEQPFAFIPQQLWESVTIDGGIYGIPTYKELGWQGGILINKSLAEEFSVDVSGIASIYDYTKVLELVEKKAKEMEKDVIGISGLGNSKGFLITHPYETLAKGSVGAYAISEFSVFKDQVGVFHQYATKEYEAYCNLVHSWYEQGFLPDDPVLYDRDIANRDRDFAEGKLFSYLIQYAPGIDKSLENSTGNEVVFLPFMKPLFETNSARGGLLAISSASKHPKEALALIQLLNTDLYVGTLIRHGIEGVHYSSVGNDRVDKTKGTKKILVEHPYDYSYGWQFGTPFNQKWDISYPDNIEHLFEAYNKESVMAPHIGFTYDNTIWDNRILQLSTIVGEYTKVLETGMVDPKETLPEFLEKLHQAGVSQWLQELQLEVSKFEDMKKKE